jgi:hypothetical protein
MIKLIDWAVFGRKTASLNQNFNIAIKFYSM